MNIRFNKKSGFSLLELMVFFLFLSIILAASTPMITKKYRYIPPRLVHGKYICYNDNGVQKQAQYNSFRQLSNDSNPMRTVTNPDGTTETVNGCSFNPPATASLFKVEIIGGGAGGFDYYAISEERTPVISQDEQPYFDMLNGLRTSDNEEITDAHKLAYVKPSGASLWEAYHNVDVWRTVTSGKAGGVRYMQVFLNPTPLVNDLYCQINTRGVQENFLTFTDPNGDYHSLKGASCASVNPTAYKNLVNLYIGGGYDSYLETIYKNVGNTLSNIELYISSNSQFKIRNGFSLLCRDLGIDMIPRDYNDLPEGATSEEGTGEPTEPVESPSTGESTGTGECAGLNQEACEKKLKNDYRYTSDTTIESYVARLFGGYSQVTSLATIADREGTFRELLSSNPMFKDYAVGDYKASGKIKQYLGGIKQTIATTCDDEQVGLLAENYIAGESEISGLIPNTTSNSNKIALSSASGGKAGYITAKFKINNINEDEEYEEIAAKLKRYAGNADDAYMKPLSCTTLGCEDSSGISAYNSSDAGDGPYIKPNYEFKTDDLISVGKIMPDWDYYQDVYGKSNIEIENLKASGLENPYDGRNITRYNGFRLINPLNTNEVDYVTFENLPTGAKMHKVFVYPASDDAEMNQDDLNIIKAAHPTYFEDEKATNNYNAGRVFYIEGTDGEDASGSVCLNNTTTCVNNTYFKTSSDGSYMPKLYISLTTQERQHKVGKGGKAGEKKEFTIPVIPENCKIYAGKGGQVISNEEETLLNEDDYVAAQEAMKSYISCDNGSTVYEAKGGEQYHWDNVSSAQVFERNFYIFSEQQKHVYSQEDTENQYLTGDNHLYVITKGDGTGASPFSEASGKNIFLKYNNLIAGKFGQGGEASTLIDGCIEGYTEYEYQLETPPGSVNDRETKGHGSQTEVSCTFEPNNSDPENSYTKRVSATAGTGGAVIISW